MSLSNYGMHHFQLKQHQPQNSAYSAIPSPHGFVGESGKLIIFTILHDIIVIKSQYPT